MRIFIVDDDGLALEILRNALEEVGYEVLCADSASAGLEVLRTGNCHVVISDWMMPGMTGPELCRTIRQRASGAYVYLILLTSRDSSESRLAGFEAGADDFISKPFDPDELASRLRVAERILALESRDVTIFALAKLAESRDPETGAHLERVSAFCEVLAGDLLKRGLFPEQLDASFVKLIGQTSPLHDIGKVAIPDFVLLKPARLSDEEFAIMKTHTTIGAETLRAAARNRPNTHFLELASDIAESHHERYDGNGYPRGLKGEQIPLAGRIVALADVYDALTSKRIYKPAMTHVMAKGIIVKDTGTHFDPTIAEAFLANETRFLEIQSRFSESQARAA